MVKSMTAFGRARYEGEDQSVTVEMKSVNSRYFDCTVKLPRSYLFLEERVKNYIRQNAVSRGKIDVYINIDRHGKEAGAVSLNRAYAEGYIAALRSLRDEYGLADDISVMTVARNPDVFTAEREEADEEAEWKILLPVLDQAIEGYGRMRAEEGRKAEEDIKGKIEHIRALTDEIERMSLADVGGYQEKLRARLRAALADERVTVDENRLLTECAIWADKIAIDEELVRLRSHFGAFYDILAMKEPSGRKLDFLIQEINRETNTIGSKCNDAQIAHLVVEIKGEIEKIREQVQNFE